MKYVSSLCLLTATTGLVLASAGLLDAQTPAPAASPLPAVASPTPTATPELTKKEKKHAMKKAEKAQEAAATPATAAAAAEASSPAAPSVAAQAAAAASAVPGSTPVASPESKREAKKEAKKEAHEQAHGDRMKMLTPEEKEKFVAAKKAAAKDPSVKALQDTRKSDPQGYNKAEKAAMLKADPSLQALFDKMHAGEKK